jgi:hypothetical protein
VIDWYSTVAIKLHLLFNDTELTHATCFFWRAPDQLYLITNWHVVSGRDAVTARPLDSVTGAVPNAVCYQVSDVYGTRREVRVDLYDRGEAPFWLVHPEYGRAVDIAALPVTDFPRDSIVRAVNDLPEVPLVTRIGMPLFVLGFPFGSEMWPVWKQATIASEPDLALRAGPNYMLVDTLSRPGMSGAPVIQRIIGRGLVETTPVVVGDPTSPMRKEWQDIGIGRCSKFIGIYSGRLRTKSAIDAQLGLVWRRHLLEQVIHGVPDRHPTEHFRDS